MFYLQLKHLEAYGFKSFADRIRIDFDNGVTAIVGPNGSGKSNITDAIRWVLGEQNVRNLRGIKAEDIIFTGSASRRQLGVAEVSLTFQNDGDLQIAYDEVVVTRRLYRSGESEFYINKSRCRLKDIYALFADTGLGHDGLSVISQNKMDEILNSRPEERRLFFEETAGITKYRDRKKDSARKLDDTEKNLERVNYILSEIETQLEPLSEQAERTKKYNKWQEQYKSCKITELYRRQLKSSEEEKKGAEKIVAIQDENLALNNEIIALEAKKSAIANDIINLENELKQKAEARTELHDEIEKINGDIRVIKERLDNGDANERRIIDECDKLEKQKKNLEAEKKNLEDAEITQKGNLADISKQIEEKRKKSAEFEDNIKIQRKAVDELNSSKESKKEEVLLKKNEIRILDEKISSDSLSQKDDETTAKKLKNDIENWKNALGGYDEKLDTLRREEKSFSDVETTSKNEKQKMQSSLRLYQQTLRINQQYISQAEAKLSVLEHMQETYEGFFKAVKMVFRSKEKWRGAVCGAVAELIDVPAKYINAIIVALGNNQQNIVTNNTETAKAAIAYLKRTRSGRATFLPLDTITEKKPLDIKVSKSQGAIGYASEVVGTEPKYKKIVNFLLSRTLIVDNIDHALEIAKNNGQRLRIVTLDGELINPGGSISGGSLQNQESGFLSRTNEIEILKGNLEKKQKEAADAKRQYDEATSKISECEKSEEEAREKLQDIRVELTGTKLKKEQLEKEIADGEGKMEALLALANERAETFAKAQEKRDFMMRDILILQRELTKIENETRLAVIKRDEVEREANDFSKYLNKLEINKVAIENEARRSREQVLMKEREISRIVQSKKDKQDELQKLRDSLESGDSEIKTLRQKQNEKELSYKELDDEYKNLFSDKMKKMTDSQENDKKIHEFRQKAKESDEHIHKLEIEQSRLKFNTEQCIDTLSAEFNLTVAEAADAALDLSDKEIKSQMRELKDAIEALGAVNLNAIDEYDKLKTRHDFMSSQVKDLNDAKYDLMRIISEMDDKMTKKFSESFIEIRKYFNEIFVALFGGGKAELILTNKNDILNSGVEIIVQLPEKKQQNLSALSGGERALTVIALLFSFLKVRPAPFSVLDEIDAPLDEANIMRFGIFLREFSKNTQFVIVTHRKGTMEAADTMYGVTLEDAGVSKILSVKLDEIE